MCGITCILCSNFQSEQKELNNILKLFKKYINNRGPDWFDMKYYYSQNCHLLFAASVLWLQGKYMTKQPLEDNKYVLVYNGDIFGGLPNKLVSEESDTKILFKLMHRTIEISTILSHVQGPYAFIYYDKVEDKLYFGRDVYGRRSLLIGKQNKVIILSSVAKRTEEYDFMEIPAIGTFYLDLKTNQLFIIPWMFHNPNFDDKLKELKRFLNKEIHIERHSLDLDNFDFLKFTEPKAEQLGFYMDIKNIEIGKIFDKLISISEWLNKILTLKNLLENAIDRRISTQPKYCRYCIKEKQICNHSLTGVLFSGGVDCAILALLADKFTDNGRPIDLINVSFDETNQFQTPDRITGLQTVEELRTLKSEREWRFLEINVSQDELNSERNRCIADLIYPLKTVLDDSLGCALWFASRGKQESMESPCRVLLVGMGADELFGGYTRHRAAYKKQGWLGLHNVLIDDWQNLPYRNLARDDRVISDHGRQLRTPYLDENVVQFVRSLNCWEKTLPTSELPQGIGEKILLRSLAYHLGLKTASSFKKRALQFGSRIANKKENAHELSTRL